MKVNWGRTSSVSILKFRDLGLNESFKIVGARAVYVKVHDEVTKTDRMLEIATGKAFAPTLSNVELVNVEVNVGLPKPSIY